MDNYSKAILKKKITRLVRGGKLRDKKIVLFGASVFSKEIKNCLSEYDIDINSIVDNDTRKIGTEFMGRKVQKPEDVLLPRNNSVAILMLSYGFYREMTHQLIQMSYIKNKNFFILNLGINESIPIFIYILARAMRGLSTYKKLTKKLSKKVMFIAPYTGTGDIYLVGLFFNQYIKKHNITDYVFVVVSGACKKVAEIFDIKNIVIIKPTITDDIINCKMFLRADWEIVVLNDGWMREKTQWIRGYKGLNFEKVFRSFVFDFKDDITHELPPRKDYSREIDTLFVKYGLIKGKTIVISPYSNTIFDLPNDFLEEIVDNCKNRGFAVCTNCAGKEKPVKGTMPVFFPLNMAVDFMDAAGYFIGVRSGLCDVISSSNCKKIIFYEKEGLFYKCSQHEYFSLKKMGLCEDALEIEYQSSEREEMLQRIFSVFLNKEVQHYG